MHQRQIKRYTPAANFAGMRARDQCSVPSCTRAPHHWGAPYCCRHAQKAFDHGHVDAATITIAELAQFSPWVEYGLDIYRNTSAVRIALERAQQLLNFTPASGASWESYLAGRMMNVRHKPGLPVDARRLLVTALSYYAFEAAHPERVMNTVVRNMGLARSLIRLGKCKQPSPRKSDLTASGAHINDMMGLFALKFLDELRKRTRADNLKRAREDKLLTDFSLPSGV